MVELLNACLRDEMSRRLIRAQVNCAESIKRRLMSYLELFACKPNNHAANLARQPSASKVFASRPAL